MMNFFFELFKKFQFSSLIFRLSLTIYFIFLLIFPLFSLLQILITYNWKLILDRALDPIAIHSYCLTFKMAFFAGLINTIFGFIISWVLTRYNFVGKKYFDAAVDLPFALPTSVAGLILVTQYNEQGFIGHFLSIFNIKILFTELGVLIAMIFVSFPFVIRTLQPALQELDTNLEEAAWSLGASPVQTFLRVIFPILWPSVLTGFTLSFSRALGEFGSIVMISANLPFKDLVASVLIYQSLEQYDYFGASVIGIVILTMSLMSLLLINTIQSFQIRS